MHSPTRRLSLRLRPSPQRARLVWGLLVALLFVQMLGVLHRIAHVDVARLQAVAAAAAGDRAGAVAAPSPARGWLGAVFAGHAGGRDCDAFEQMSHGDAAVAVTTLDLGDSAPAMAPEVSHPAWHIAAQARGFLARGPPIAA